MNEIFFYFLFSLILSFVLLDHVTGLKNRSTIQFFYILIILSGVAITRSVGFGSDDQAYIDIYKTISQEGFFRSLAQYEYSALNVELGFVFLLGLFSLLGGSHFLIFGGVGFVSVYLNLQAIKSFTPYFVVSVLIYFSHFFIAKELNAIRVGLASALLFYAALALYEQKWITTFLTWMAAVLIHITAVLFILPVALFTIKPSRNLLMFLAVLILFLSFMFSAKDLAYSFISFGFVGDKISLYLESDKYSYGIPLFDVVNIKNLLLLFLSFVMWRRLSLHYKGFYMAFIFFYTASLFRILLGDFAVLAGRGYSVFAMFEFVLIPMVCVAFLGRGLGLLLAVIYASLTLWMNLNFNTAWSGGTDFFYDWPNFW